MSFAISALRDEVTLRFFLLWFFFVLFQYWSPRTFSLVHYEYAIFVQVCCSALSSTMPHYFLRQATKMDGSVSIPCTWNRKLTNPLRSKRNKFATTDPGALRPARGAWGAASDEGSSCFGKVRHGHCCHQEECNESINV